MSKLKNTAKANTPKPSPQQVTVQKVAPAKTGGGGKAIQKPMPKTPGR